VVETVSRVVETTIRSANAEEHGSDRTRSARDTAERPTRIPGPNRILRVRSVVVAAEDVSV
jgi:hypothetical protein